MLKKIKKSLKNNILIYYYITKFIKVLRKYKYQIFDIYNSYLAHSMPSKMTPYGFYLTGSSSIHHKAMQDGDFELEEVGLFRKIFQTTDVFIDVGANIGFYGCLAKTHGNHVISIEPLSRNLEYLLENVKANNWENFEIYPIGLSDHHGQAFLYGASSTGASLIGSWAGSSRKFKRTIVLSTLDAIVGRRFEDKKIFIKIDVEGAEYPVLMGGIELASRNLKPTWVLEICLDEYHPTGLNPNFQKTFEFFWNLGYQAKTADKYQKLITPSDVDRYLKEGTCDSGNINYIFTPV